MRKRVLIFAGILEALVVLLFLWCEPSYRVRGAVFGEAVYDGKPTSYWRQEIDRWMHQYGTREEALNAMPCVFILGDADVIWMDVGLNLQGMGQVSMVSYFAYLEPTPWDRLRSLVKYRNHRYMGVPAILWAAEGTDAVLDELAQDEKYREIVRRARSRPESTRNRLHISVW